MIGSCFFIGAFLGSFVLPTMADVYGRKPLFLLGLVLYLVDLVGIHLGTKLWQLYPLMVLSGIAESGRYYVAYVYVVEILPKRLQNAGGLVIFIAFACVKVSICLYFVYAKSRNWHILGYMAAIFATFSFVATSLFLPESPRFLYSKGDFRKTEQVLKQVAYINGYSSVEWQLTQKRQTQEESQSLKELFLKDKVIRNNLLIMLVIWSFCSFSFFLIPFYLSSIDADFYALSFSSEIAEFIASIICLFITKLMKLERALFMFLSLVVVSALGLMGYKLFMESHSESSSKEMHDIINGVLIMLTNLGAVCSFDIAYLVNPELFPTMVLASAYGACNVFGRMISISSPIVARIPNPYPLIILITYCGVCSVLVTKLKKIPSEP